jgi:hypothetical protein
LDFTVRGQGYRGSTRETKAARAAKVACLKLAQAVEGRDPLPCKPAALVSFLSDSSTGVASLVAPSERSFASALTNVARNVCWAIGSAVAGLLMQDVAFSPPLLVGGGAKIADDLLLLQIVPWS